MILGLWFKVLRFSVLGFLGLRLGFCGSCVWGGIFCLHYSVTDSCRIVHMGWRFCFVFCGGLVG